MYSKIAKRNHFFRELLNLCGEEKWQSPVQLLEDYLRFCQHPPPPRSHDQGQYDRTALTLQASVALSLEKEEDKADLGHGTRAQVVKVNACFYLGK